MKIKLLIFLGLALVGIHGMSAPADVPAMDGWTDALDVAIGKHEEYVAVREARIEALRQQLVHAGISPEVTPVYTQQPWWIHESQIDRRVAEKYRWPYMDTPDGRFYRCSGNPAYPFLYPAMKDNEEQILKVLGGSLASDLEDI